MSKSEVQSLVVPNTFVIPETYTLDKDFGKMLTLTNPWKYTFEDLPEYDKDGNEYYYAIIEVEVPTDYEVSYSPQQPVKASDIRANMLERAEAEANDQPLPDLLTLTATNTTTIVVEAQVTLKKVDVANLKKNDLTAEDLLKGAAFRVTKYVNKTFREKDTDWGTGGSVELADVKNGENYTLNGTFTFMNLPKGFYLIEETAFPNGYIRLESNPRFEIGDDKKVYLLDASGNRIEENQSEIIRVLPVTATQTDNVMIYGNTPGAALPNTGGPGKRLFTILGSILILGSGVLLWRRRRTI
jgi:LPXTG-motif cell wall-anchored protein